MTRTLSDNDLVDVTTDLVRPQSLVVDARHDEVTARRLVRAAQLLSSFWNSGNVGFLEEAIDASFVDNTLPPGRPQGPEGPAGASKAFRAAVPDLSCELVELLVAGDRVTARLRFRGHFTGVWEGRSGSGQAVDFIAIDVQRVELGRIVEVWHIEDNLKFLTQIGAIERPAETSAHQHDR